jgi:hypothetical protein
MRTTKLLAAAPLALALAACGTSRGAQAPAAGEVRGDAPVRTAHPYEVKGTVQSTGGFLGIGRSVAIAREDAPTVVLQVAEGTRITIDDRPAQLSDLREGDEVRAVFDFDGSSAVAIDIEVDDR